MAMLNNQMVKIKKLESNHNCNAVGYNRCRLHCLLLCCGSPALKFSGLRCLRNLRELELQNAIVWVRSPATSVSCHQFGGAFRHLVLLPRLREMGRMWSKQPPWCVVFRVPFMVAPKWIRGGVHFIPFSWGQAFPGRPRPNPLPVASQHITDHGHIMSHPQSELHGMPSRVKPRGGLDQRCPWEGARRTVGIGGLVEQAACCS